MGRPWCLVLKRASSGHGALWPRLSLAQTKTSPNTSHRITPFPSWKAAAKHQHVSTDMESKQQSLIKAGGRLLLFNDPSHFDRSKTRTCVFTYKCTEADMLVVPNLLLHPDSESSQMFSLLHLDNMHTRNFYFNSFCLVFTLFLGIIYEYFSWIEIEFCNSKYFLKMLSKINNAEEKQTKKNHSGK